MNRFVFEFTFTGVMFCSYLIAIAFVVELVYGIQDSSSQFSTLSIAIAVVLAVFSVSYALLFCLWPQKFGEFSTMFVENKFFSRMYPLMILERWATSACLIVAIATQLSVIGGIAMSVVLLISCLVLQFHKETSHRVRFAFNMGISAIVMGIYLAYNLVDEQTKSSVIFLYLPLVVIGLLSMITLLNAAFLIKALLANVCSKDKGD